MSDKKVYNVYKVSADSIIQTVELYSKWKENGKEFDVKHVSNALHVSEVNANNSIKAAEQLGLFDVAEKVFEAPKEVQRMLFKEALQNYRPFLDFIEFLYKGYKPIEAISRVKALYDVNKKDNDILWTFKNWGMFGGIFKNNKFEFSEELKVPVPSIVDKLKEMLNDELKTKMWIENLLEQAKSMLQSTEVDSLVNALLRFEKEPRDSIGNTGELLEDLLRRIAAQYNVNVKKKHGISEIAQELRTNKLIAAKHKNILDGLGAFRNMADHGIDSDENNRWS